MRRSRHIAKGKSYIKIGLLRTSVQKNLRFIIDNLQWLLVPLKNYQYEKEEYICLINQACKGNYKQ